MIAYGKNALFAFLEDLGGLFLFFLRIFETGFKTRGNVRTVLDQIALVSFRSLSTILFAGVFVGAILVLQFHFMLKGYDALSFLGGMNTNAIISEVGPLIISFLLAGKIGAYTAAELGTMRVTEQIDAIECLGTDSVQYLILPRFAGIILSSVVLLILGLMMSIISAIIVADLVCGVNFLQYVTSIPKFTNLWTVFSGTTKCVIYSTIVASVACYKGFTASGGARGVGRAVTLAAVYTNFYIVIANYISSGVLGVLENVGLTLIRGY